MTTHDNNTWLERLHAVECPDATFHPERYPVVLQRAAGSIVWDVEGHGYIDLCAGFGALPLGHAPPELHDVFATFAATGHTYESAPPMIHGLGDLYPSTAKVELLEAIARFLPPHLERGGLAISGSQAVEFAIKTAVLRTRRPGVIAFSNAYHGLDLGVLSLTDWHKFRTPFGAWGENTLVTHLPFGSPSDEIEAAFQTMSDRGHPVGALLVEPMQGRGGVRSAPPGWLVSLRELCTRSGAALIFDEVFTGFGRTGRMSFAHDVPCDLVCLGKAMGGGFPLSACFGTSEFMDAWPESISEALHTGTFFGHPLSCAVALATLQAIDKHALVERSRRLGATTLESMRQRWSTRASVKDIRGEGLMLAIEFHATGRGAWAMDELRGRGVIAIPSGDKGQCLSLTPALNIPEQLLGEALDVIDQIVD